MKMKNLLFYYPQHFNRSKDGTNPFFDRMLEICDRHGIDYDLMEEPDRGTDKPRNPRAAKADAFFWAVTVIRKIFSIVFPKRDFYKREATVAKALNCLTLGRYRYRKYITISGSMYHLFANLNPKADVYDMQHGILYKEHPTFFKDRHLRPQFYQPNLHFLFWGKGYEQCFANGDEEVLSGRTHVVGYPISVSELQTTQNGDRKMIVSLQFTHDLSENELRKDKQILEAFLAETESSGYEVLLKHHPRFNNAISIDDILARYGHASLTTEPLHSLAKKVQLHVTYFSTTAFEYAAYGIPTFFMPAQGREPVYSLFYTEYGYPLYKGMGIKQVLSRLQDPDKRAIDAAAVVDWHSRFYTPFDEAAFLNKVR